MEDTSPDSHVEPALNPPPAQAMQAPAPVLTGNIQTFSSDAATPFGQTGGGEITYITGPDGQMYAYEKPPFNMKQFAIGLCLPLLLIGITGLGNAIFDGDLNIDDPSTGYDVEMQAVDNSTAFILNINLSANEIVVDCYIDTKEEIYSSYWCEGEDNYQDLTIYMDDDNFQMKKVGAYTYSETRFDFDDGESHDEVIIFYRIADAKEYQAYGDERDAANSATDIFAIFCFLAPIVGIGGSIYGFASGKKDMGIGFLVGTALLPFAFFALLVFLW
jgi:hypothetical protein